MFQKYVTFGNKTTAFRLYLFKFLLPILFILIHISAAYSIGVDALYAFKEKELSSDGYSADLALHPHDGSLHVVWVNRYENIEYAIRTSDGFWSQKMIIPEDREVQGQEEDGVPRKCLGITFDRQGVLHLVFSDNNGDIYYMNNGLNNVWTTPELIVTKNAYPPNFTLGHYYIYLDIVASAGNLYVAYEDANLDQVYTIINSHGIWGGPIFMSMGEYPSLEVGTGGRVYFICRQLGYNHNVMFASLIPDVTDWQFNSEVTDAARRCGQGPGMCVGDGNIYLAWNNSTGIDGPTKGELFCAMADEPGTDWNPRLGGNSPLVYENTGDTHPRVQMYSDHTLLYIVGCRNERYFVRSNDTWSAKRIAPWNDNALYSPKVIPQVACDGKNVWVVTSLAGSSLGDVLVSCITNPHADYADPEYNEDVDVLELITKRDLEYSGFSADVAVNPVDGSVRVAWVRGGDIKYRIREVSGDWLSGEIIDDGGLNIYGQEGGGNPRMCMGMDIAEDGDTHIVFADDQGDLYYTQGLPGNWSIPERIVEKSGYTIYPDIEVIDNTICVVYEDADENQIYSILSINGIWGIPSLIGDGDYPSIASGDNGMVYLSYRGTDQSRNVNFGYMVPGFTDWRFTENVTNAYDQVGGGPGMAVYDDKIYMAWNNNTGAYDTTKSEMYCAFAEAPGKVWGSKFGAAYPIYYEDTGDPHPRVGVYSDGKVLYLNGKRWKKRFMVWNGLFWTDTRTAPWNDGIPKTASDGRTIWVVVSSTSSQEDTVSCTGIRSNADFMDLLNSAPDIASQPNQTANENTPWQYTAQATDNDADILTWSLTLKPEGMDIDGPTGQISWTPTHIDYEDDPWGEGQGKHLVGVRVRDGNGGADVQYFWLQVERANHNPEITFIADDETYEDSLYTYQVTATDADGDPLTYELTVFPAGMTIGSQTGLITWTPSAADIGSHDITVRVQDNMGGETLQSYTLTVLDVPEPPPVPDFVANVTSGFAPLSVTFTDQSTGEIISREWDFGDQAKSTQISPMHTYLAAGTYTVSLTATGPGGTVTETKTDYIAVSQKPLTAWFGADIRAGIKPLTVQFTDSSFGEATSWLWDFGDGGSSTEQHPEHTYNQAGVFSVQLIASGPVGTDTLMRDDYITVNELAPVARFGADIRQGTVPLTVQFTDSSTGVVTDWLWKFGDGSTSTDQHPEHVYTSAGLYTVKLTVSGSGGVDSLSRADFITAQNEPPVAAFGADPKDGTVPLLVLFSDSSAGDVNTWLWDFGDGNYSTEQDPYNLYTEAGKYTVMLIVTGPGGSASVTKDTLITVSETSDVSDNGLIPHEYCLHPNFPNPFNPSTTLQYDLPKAGMVYAAVFDMMGKRVSVLENARKNAGIHYLKWTGRDNEGRLLPSGVYVIRLKANEFEANQKMLFMK